MADAARATGAGVLRGLYECRGVTDGDLLLSWAADFALDEAESTLAQLRERGLAPSQERTERARPRLDGLVGARRTLT